MTKRQLERYITDNLTVAYKNNVNLETVLYANRRAHAYITEPMSQYGEIIDRKQALQHAEWWAMAGRRAALNQ